jgi:hypothetical protein
MAMMDPMGLGDEPQVLVTVAKKARCPFFLQSLKDRRTITSMFSIVPPKAHVST